MHLKNVGESIHVYYKTTQLLHKSGQYFYEHIEVNQGSDREFMCSNVNESDIAGSSVLRDIIVQVD